MKNSHAPAPLLLLASLLATVCAAQEPADFGGVAEGATKNMSRRGSVIESEPPILVTVDAKRKVYFGKEQVGTTGDVGPLKERVRQAIERRRQAARERGDEEAAKSSGTVFICAPPELKYRDVLKVVDAIKEAGGSPVGLSTGCKPPRRESDA
jgi:biopolymer transport protein ExbD